MMCSVMMGELRKQGPCTSGWAKLRRYLHKHEIDATQDSYVPLFVILKSNGLDDALWCLKALDKSAVPALFNFAVDCAREALKVLPLGEAAWALANKIVDAIEDTGKLSVALKKQCLAYEDKYMATYAAYMPVQYLVCMALLKKTDPHYMQGLGYECAACAEAVQHMPGTDAAYTRERKRQTASFTKHFCTEEE